MVAFIKNNKLNLDFGKSSKEVSDISLEKENETVALHIGDTVLSNNSEKTTVLDDNITDSSTNDSAE